MCPLSRDLCACPGRSASCPALNWTGHGCGCGCAGVAGWDAHQYPLPNAPLANASMIACADEYGATRGSVGHEWIASPPSPTCPHGWCDMYSSEVWVGNFTTYSDLLQGMIANRGLSSAIYTQCSDVEAEMNGILTYDRVLKLPPLDADRVRALNLRLWKSDDIESRAPLRLGPLEFSEPPVLIATTPWADTSGESFYRLNSSLIVGSTMEAGCRGSGCTFASQDGGKSWREWAAGEYKSTVPAGLQRDTIDGNFFPVLPPMQWLARGSNAAFFKYGGFAGLGPNATHIPGGGFRGFRALPGTVLEFPTEPDETGIPAKLSPMLEPNISYTGLPWPVRAAEFCAEDAHGDLMETADGALLHVVSLAWNPTPGCNWNECNRSGTLRRTCTPPGFICNRGSIVAFRSEDGGHEFTFAAVVANSSWYDLTSAIYSHEGAGEPDSAMLRDGTVVTVMRFDAGDACQWGPFPEDVASCYKNYRASRSTSHGRTWSVPMTIPKAGTARPRVTSFGGSWLLLTGGRMFNQGRNDLGLWWSADGAATDYGWHGTSLTYVHNLLAVNSSQLCPAVLNATNVRATTAYTSLLRLTPTAGLIVYERQIHWWNPVPPHLPTPLSQWFSLSFRFSPRTSKNDDDAALPLLASIFADNAVLQRAPATPQLWGWAAASATVTVQLSGLKRLSTVVGPSGSWSVTLPPQLARTNVSLVVTCGSHTVGRSNLAFGEVIFFGG